MVASKMVRGSDGGAWGVDLELCGQKVKKEWVELSGIQGRRRVVIWVAGRWFYHNQGVDLYLRSEEFPSLFPFFVYATPTPGQENYQPLGSRFESELGIGMIQLKILIYVHLGQAQ